MTEKRIVKRYTNRKLYDKQESRYVTLEEIARLVREGEDVSVVDNETEEDLTAVTFAQIILEEEKRKTSFISVPFLRKLIRSGEARVQDFSEVLGDFTGKAGERFREVVEGSGRALGDSLSFLDEILELPQKRLEEIRERARRSVKRLGTSPAVRKELERIVSSLRTLEEAITRLNEEDRKHDEDQSEAGAGRRSESGPEREDTGETDSNGFATPAGTIRSTQGDEEQEPFSEPGEERPSQGRSQSK